MVPPQRRLFGPSGATRGRAAGGWAARPGGLSGAWSWSFLQHARGRAVAGQQERRV